MIRKCFSLCLSICLTATIFIFSSPLGFASDDITAGSSLVKLEQANQILQSNRNCFTENKGQWPEEIFFVGNTDFGRVVFTQGAIYYQLINTSYSSKDRIDRNEIEHHKEFEVGGLTQAIAGPYPEMDDFALSAVTHVQTIKLSFVNVQTPLVQGKILQSHHNNYFIGNDSSTWATDCRNFSQVLYTDVWDGIDLAYFFTPDSLKYEYYVHPGADVQDLQIQVIGADLLSNEESLELLTPLGNLKDDKLLVYSQDSQLPIQASFQVHNDTFSFDVDEDVCRDETIVIDPIVYSTYLGGTQWDTANAIAVDNLGAAYVTGITNSPDFPKTQTNGGAPAPGYNQILDPSQSTFVTKLNPSGTEILYSTYLGGTSAESSVSISVDDLGNAYVTGHTASSDFPMSQTFGGAPAPGYDQTFNGSWDVFVVKINPSGTELLYSTYLGGTNLDQSVAISTDEDGNAYIIGYTYSDDFPVTQTIGGSLAPGYDQSYNGDRDIFLVKLNPSGTQLLYATYYGGTQYDVALDFFIDEDGNAYLTGVTSSIDLPMTQTLGGSSVPGYDQTYKGAQDVFVVKFNPSGTQLLYATYLGGSNQDWGYCVDVDENGYAYVTGITHSPDFPKTQTVEGSSVPGYDQTFDGSSTIFVVKLTPSGTELLYSTFLGGSNYNYILSIATDDNGFAYLMGYTTSPDFPMEKTLGGMPAPGYDKTFNGLQDVFIVKLNPLGTELHYATFLGGDEYDRTEKGVIDDQGSVYVVGSTTSYNFPMTQTNDGTPAPGYDQTYNGIHDGFVVKIDIPEPVLEIQVQADRSTYSEGNLPILTVDLTNSGDSFATDCEVLITLPPELAFLEEQTLLATPGPGESLTFHVGDLLSSNTTSFPVYVEVVENVPADTDVFLYFDATCLENATDSTSFLLRLLHIAPPPSCPNLFIEGTPNKTSYYFREMVYLNVTVRNLGGRATHVTVDVELPRELTYAGCDKYRATSQGNHLSIAIGNLDTDEVIRFVLYLEVTTDVQKKKTAPIVLDMYAKECDAFARKIVNITLEPKRTGQQNLDVSVKLLNLEFDEETGQYYLPFDQTLEMQLQVSGYETHYNYTIHWGDGETTTLDKESSATILLKHKFTAKGSMNIKITIQDPGGREKTSTLYVTVK